MAVEVRAQQFLFRSNALGKVRRDGKSRPTNIRARVKFPDEDSAPGDQTVGPYTWFYNPLHDMESIFWLMLYFISNKDTTLGAPTESIDSYQFTAETEDDRRRRILSHWNFGLNLFSSRQDRFMIIVADGVLKDHFHAHPLHPAIVPLADVLCRLRSELAAQYTAIERDPRSIHHNSGQEVHNAYAALLQRAVAHLQTVPFEVEVRSLRSAVEALPKSYQQQRVDKVSKSVMASTSAGSKRVREDGDAGRQPKSQRVSLDQKSPSRKSSPDATPATKPLPQLLPKPNVAYHSRRRASCVRTQER